VSERSVESIRVAQMFASASVSRGEQRGEMTFCFFFVFKKCKMQFVYSQTSSARDFLLRRSNGDKTRQNSWRTNAAPSILVIERSTLSLAQERRDNRMTGDGVEHCRRRFLHCRLSRRLIAIRGAAECRRRFVGRARRQGRAPRLDRENPSKPGKCQPRHCELSTREQSRRARSPARRAARSPGRRNRRCRRTRTYNHRD